ncbi:MAG: AbiJ-NTD4 domain-containing protein [Methylococcaceae bacterium]
MTETNLYFSERETGLPPQVEEEITERAYLGLVSIIYNLIANQAFGEAFPEKCSQHPDTSGINKKAFDNALISDIGSENYDYINYSEERLKVLDLIEFCYKHVAKPTSTGNGSCWGHSHYVYDREEGQKEFRNNINELFKRHGLAYELKENGQVIRLIPFVFQESLQSSFQTGNTELNELLEQAKEKYLSPDPNTTLRREALEKLWDAWERLKTMENPSDKATSIRLLLDKASVEPKFKERLDKEGRELTEIGNKFYIRHTELIQTPINSSDHFDYLFQRMFAMIHLLLKARK